ncbi:MAG: Gfo/Idh/MocA family oxidoreductase [Micropruina sp.]|uniref:Gfo/Idh/MocA family protein n=1 Tax=Micropruina sp. TaxID=2737536 RepID=UPI0039E24EA9
MEQVRLAVAGAGLIGKRHLEEIDRSDAARLHAIVEPGPDGAPLAAQYGVPLYASLGELFAAGKPDGVILATPNRLHVDGGLECVAAGVPTIVEKPIGDTVENAARLVEAAERAGVPVLTGHHRNYSPVMAKAREVVASGRLGRLVAVVGTAMFYKPDDYFDVGGGWRRMPGGGPILLNLIHEVNNLLSLVGDIVRVQAVTSNATRGFGVEDTAAMVFTFANGALGTFLLSDTAGSARSWEQTARENLSYSTFPDEDCYHLAGTDGSLSVPTMRIRTFPGTRSWWEPMETVVEDVERTDPLANQISHFAAVIRGEAEPICSARDGLKTLRVVEAVVEAARTGSPVDIVEVT